MTTEELEDAIRAGDQSRCIELIKSATEPERRAAASLAQKWQSAAWDRHRNEEGKSGIALPENDEEIDRIYSAASASVAGTVTLAELKKLGWRVWHLEEPAWRLLGHRNAEWLQEGAEWILGENRRSWSHVRALVRDGTITRPTGDTYITAMIGHLWPECALDLLRSDPELLEHEVWRLFEVEGGGEDSLAARDKFTRGDHSWSHALQTLSEEGSLSRDRLLDASLDALARDFGQFRVAWFSQFHEAMSPTLEEREARVERYFGLLASRIPPTVSFALKALALLDKSDRLPGKGLVAQIAPALGAREKGTVMLSLKLLDRAAKRDPVLAAPATLVATEALMHEKPEVQAASLDLIERYGSRSDRSLVDLVRGRLQDLSPSQRPRADAWLGASAAETPTEAPVSKSADEEIGQAAALPEKWRTLAGVDAALAALNGDGAPLPVVDLAFGRIPILNPGTLLTPIATLDELIDVCASVIENLGPPDEIERMLDGISRLCGERPDDFQRRAGPLASRARKLATKHNDGVAFLGWMKLDFPLLVQAWTTGTVAKRGKSDVDMTFFHGRRMFDVAQRAAAGKPSLLLAMPTHSGGWLDPRVLVQRALEIQAQTLKPALHDTVQALLRLAPEHRAEALVAAADLTNEVGEAVRYALGGNGIEIGPTLALWIAAARARAPRGNDAALDALYPGLGPDAACAAQCTLTAEREVYVDRGKEYSYYTAELSVSPPTPKRLDESQPTVMLHASIELEPKDLEVRRWLATVWPAGKEAWFAQGVRVLAHNIDWSEAEWSNRIHLEALLEPDTALGEMGLMLLGLGLAAKEPGESGLCTDAAIAALRDGRLNGPLLGATLTSLISLGVEALTPLQRKQRERDPNPPPLKSGGYITAARWARTLAEVARASALHADAVHSALQHALSSQPSLRPADLAALLELLHELSVQLDASIEQPEARSFLEAQQGGGKGGKLAKALLALPPSDQSARRAAVARLALEGRIERAERWLAMDGSGG